MRLLDSVLVMVVVLVWGGVVPGEDFVWVEGESAVGHGMQRHGWYDSVKKDDLSNNEWLSHFAGGQAPVAEYEVEVEVGGQFYFWVRANSVAGPRLSYRLDGGPWKEIDLGEAVENVNIASDGKPDMRFISWVEAGRVSLGTGGHRVAFKFHSANNNHGGLDCFVFSRRPFMPRGALKPGQRTGKANPGYFAWEPDVDPFSGEALVDLSGLNEDVAGARGRVGASGNGFVLADGRAVNFWGANAGGVVHQLDHQSHVYLARHLAKRGVNMVRMHGGIYGSRDGVVDMRKLDNIHHFVWALKQEGIYTKLSFYFPAWFRLDQWHAQGNRWPFMLLFFDPDMQRIYFKWAHTLLTTRNPYTGVPLGEERAVAIVEIQNEDSHFFWTFDKKNAPPERWETFKGVYGAWLKGRYGSIDKAVSAWGGRTVEGDDVAGGKMELLSAWSMTRDGIAAAGRNRKRVEDQVRFLTENMRGFYEKAIAYFRGECGYGGLVSCGNWRTADAGVLGPLERYCYTAGDVIDHHGYFDHGHEGENSGWSVRPGHTFSSMSALGLRRENPLPYVEIDGYPSIISEIGWPMPNMYRAEWPFLTAAYGCLSGLDGIFHFSLGSANWDQGVSKFPMSDPAVLGSFFAAGLVYRRNYVREAPSVVEEHSAVEDLLALKGSNVFVRGALDQLRAAQVPAGRTGRIDEPIDPAVFYVGRVTRSFKGTGEDSRLMGVGEFVDHEKKVIASSTGQLRLNYGEQVVTMNTAKAQGAAGFLGRKGIVRLGYVDIQMGNDYGTVLVVSLDDQPLAISKKVLIQCMTVDQLYGWASSQSGGMGGTIHSVGSAPWGVEKIQATVTLRSKGGGSGRVIVCDENGYATDKKTAVSVSGGAMTLKINETATYTVVLR